MIAILSPAKNLDEDKKNPISRTSTPQYLDVAEKLVNKLSRLSRQDLQELLSINDNLTDLNYNRYKNWVPAKTVEEGRHAVLSYDGDVYKGLSALSLNMEDLNFAQKKLRILSGLYGILRPLDLIAPYRLEMSTKIGLNNKKDLYQLWTEKITQSLNEALKGDRHKVVLNLASQEYVKAIDTKNLNGQVITPVFKELKGEEYRTFFVFVKRARGMMTRYFLKNKITNPEELKNFNVDGYAFAESLSDENSWVFTR